MCCFWQQKKCVQHMSDNPDKPTVSQPSRFPDLWGLFMDFVRVVHGYSLRRGCQGPLERKGQFELVLTWWWNVTALCVSHQVLLIKPSAWQPQLECQRGHGNYVSLQLLSSFHSVFVSMESMQKHWHDLLRHFPWNRTTPNLICNFSLFCHKSLSHARAFLFIKIAITYRAFSGHKCAIKDPFYCQSS